MRNILGILLSAIFAILGLFHIYWAIGGKFGSAAAVPTVGGERTFNPSTVGTLLVAAALFVATLVIAGNFGWFGKMIPGWIFRWTTFGIALLFLVRSIGDFKMVGFFKKSSDSGFAYWDTMLFSPLCLFIALAAFVIAYSQADIQK